jgi:hypothetical protein
VAIKRYPPSIFYSPVRVFDFQTYVIVKFLSSIKNSENPYPDWQKLSFLMPLSPCGRGRGEKEKTFVLPAKL